MQTPRILFCINLKFTVNFIADVENINDRNKQAFLHQIKVETSLETLHQALDISFLFQGHEIIL